MGIFKNYIVVYYCFLIDQVIGVNYGRVDDFYFVFNVGYVVNVNWIFNFNVVLVSGYVDVCINFWFNFNVGNLYIFNFLGKYFLDGLLIVGYFVNVYLFKVYIDCIKGQVVIYQFGKQIFFQVVFLVRGNVVDYFWFKNINVCVNFCVQGFFYCWFFLES